MTSTGRSCSGRTSAIRRGPTPIGRCRTRRCRRRALAATRTSGAFSQVHDAYWASARRRLGKTAGTRALVEVLLLQRTLPAAACKAGIGPALAAGSVDPAVVAVEARRARDGDAAGAGTVAPIGCCSATTARLRCSAPTTSCWLAQGRCDERAHRAPGWTDTGLVFTVLDGTGVHPQVIARRFDQLGRKAGLPRITFHGARHTYATAALAAGSPARVVQERLGHSSVAVKLGIYSQVLPNLERSASEQVAAMFLG